MQEVSGRLCVLQAAVLVVAILAGVGVFVARKVRDLPGNDRCYLPVNALYAKQRRAALPRPIWRHTIAA